jgi:choline kinase/gamma-glutamyl-gamma-aminobutyrate hydrolase PuuD
VKPLLLSQRVDVLNDLGERRDAVDQRLVAWLADCGYLAVPVPNNPELLEGYWQLVQPVGVVLSGGNDLANYGGNAPERDATERALLGLAMTHGRPLFALCRGAQLLLDAFGNGLEKVAGHVGTRHQLRVNGQAHEVNSFHQWGSRELKAPLQVLARSDDGVIEAFEHLQLPILGVLWHPEREAPFNPLDRALLQRCLAGRTILDGANSQTMTRAIILAAGRGSRMGAMTAEQPKCFAVLHGRRLLDWQLAALRGAGISELAIVRGYLHERFEEPLEYFENPRWQQSNMVRTLLAADAWLSSATCIVSYSDIVYSAATVAALATTAGDLAIAYDPDWLALWAQRFAEPLADAESFVLDPLGNLASIGERCQSTEEIQGQYMGLLKFTPAGWALVKQQLANLDEAAIDKLDMTSLLRRLLGAGVPIALSPVQGLWGEVDEPGDLALYHRLIPATALTN